MKSKVRKGKKIEILEDIGVIPSGIYRLVDEDEEMFHFHIRDRVFFGITKDGAIDMQLAPKTALLTSVTDFIERYYPLIESEREKDLDLTKPFTFCALDPKVAPEVH